MSEKNYSKSRISRRMILIIVSLLYSGFIMAQELAKLGTDSLSGVLSGKKKYIVGTKKRMGIWIGPENQTTRSV